MQLDSTINAHNVKTTTFALDSTRAPIFSDKINLNFQMVNPLEHQSKKNFKVLIHL